MSTKCVHRIVRDAGGLQAERARVEQRLIVARLPAELIRDAVERLVVADRPGDNAAERDVGVLGADRLRGAIRPLELPAC